MGDYAALKEMLAAWNLSELFQHFEAENINIEELKMMKFHHISLALQFFTLGTRIRFEHHLEEWRQSLHRPLQCVTSAASCHCKCAPSAYGEATLPTSDLQHETSYATEARSMTSTDRLMHEPMIDVNEFNSDDDLAQNNNNNSNSNNNNDEYLLQPFEKPTTPSVALKSRTRRKGERERLNKEKQARPPVSVKHILTHCGPKGLELHNCSKDEPLTTAQRTLLVNLIASYFREHNLHLTLYASHTLEREILKLFPLEKLSSYRTEKRGKIYIKFTNLKRFKKPAKTPRTAYKRKSKSSSDADHENVFDEPAISLENLEEVTIIESHIKVEDDYN